jgi:hypothetical protein
VTAKERHLLRVSRDAVLFVTGLAGVVYETVITKVDRPTLLLLFAAMIGLPTFLRGDEVHQDGRGKPHEREDDAEDV